MGTGSLRGPCVLQVGRAAGAEVAALQVVDSLQKRLRQVACQVSRARNRPKLLSLAGLQPLCLGKLPHQLLRGTQPCVVTLHHCGLNLADTR